MLDEITTVCWQKHELLQLNRIGGDDECSAERAKLRWRLLPCHVYPAPPRRSSYFAGASAVLQGHPRERHGPPESFLYLDTLLSFCLFSCFCRVSWTPFYCGFAMKKLFGREKPKLAKPVQGSKDIAASGGVVTALPEVSGIPDNGMVV